MADTTPRKRSKQINMAIPGWLFDLIEEDALAEETTCAAIARRELVKLYKPRLKRKRK